MKTLVRKLLTLFAVLFLFGCAAKQMITLPEFEAKQFDKTMYTSKIDNFLILFDASSSMSESGKFDAAQALVTRMNETLPEMGQTAGLRSFGHSPKVSKKSTELFYGMEQYVSDNLENNFGKITEPGGSSPIYKAINEAGNDFNGLSGDMNAVIIITDGLDMKKDALKSAKALKERYGSSICFYPVLVGDSAEGEVMLQEIATIGECGFYSLAGELLTSAGMANFVEKVFLDKKAVPVAPPVKVAPPAPVKPVTPMRKDSDHDGVYDDEDKCPGTPMGAAVNALGCWVLDNVLFDFDKAVIRAQAYPLLDNVADILEKNPGMGIDLHGHCDNIGTAEYNMGLSMRRANAVKQYLTGKGILENRMSTKGFGFTKPVEPNNTSEGRSLNRRVEIYPY
ncbi:OmpA family protein [Desulfobacula phenolica]|uniref:OmpA-OmpF porin, OOP family n=1 Tax=Desulfobacula phenolica TaxID=90732 RepID=A0A1H2J9B9_9BACT|nr:OmpA family protein [Desulfobacula phenolica]SDU53010.1 OmpA-OmpF porin, OOP family [Desulfobacula phenolica]